MVNCGKGTLDLFEILKYKVSNMYKQLNPPNYFERYFCFQIKSHFKPEDHHIDLSIPFKILLAYIDE